VTGLILLLALVLVLTTGEFLTMAWQRTHRNRISTVTSKVSAAAPPVAPPAGPAEVEQALKARLLAGQLDPELYRDGMAAIASTVSRTAAGFDESPSPTPDSGSLRLLAAALPELPTTTVRAAVDLAQLGASVEDLVRLLDLTSPQALRVIVATTGAMP